jgi:ubiquinone/menaquinone biosynthesis C-methylase UbiE
MTAVTEKPLGSVEVVADRTTMAYQDFLLGAKLFWSKKLYKKVHEDYLDAIEKRDTPPQDTDSVEDMMKNSSAYQFYGWLERHIQRLKYAGAYGIAPTVAKQREQFEEVLNAAAEEGLANGQLRLNPDIAMPRYYTAVDFHQHPGGVWGDELAGIVYEWARSTTTPLHLHVDDMHFRLADQCPAGDYKRILDWGCGIGKSTYPFALKYPDAEVYGIDIAAPCLKLAYLRAREKGLNIKYSQQLLEKTDFAANFFDLIHGTFMIHELPKPALKECVKEAFRILAPGGRFVLLDFHSPPGGVFGRFIIDGHARRNNEVFMRSLMETDFVGMLKEIGFKKVEMLPYDDSTGIISDPNTVPQAWRFPWQMFVAEKS